MLNRTLMIGYLAFLLLAALGCFTMAYAETGLYVNRDNKSWSLERTFAFPEDCDKEARSLYRSGKVLGVGCADYNTDVFRNAPAARPQVIQQQAPGQQQPDPNKDKDVKYWQRVQENDRRSSPSMGYGEYQQRANEATRQQLDNAVNRAIQRGSGQ